MSFKRSFQLLVTFLVIIIAIVIIEPKVLLMQLKIVVAGYVFYNLYAGRFIPAAIDPNFGTWRGIELQKNHLGQTGIYCLLSSLVFYGFDKTRLTKIFDAVLMFVSVYLIYKSHSSTSTIVVAIIVFMILIFKIESIFFKLKVGRSLLGLTFLYILIFSVIILIFATEIFGLIPGYFGKDLTLSGRVDIWEFVWYEIEKEILLGYGFATYWIMGHARLLVFADYFNTMVNQAHNGFLEIMLQLGVVGSISFLFLIIAYVFRMLKLNSNLAIVIFVSIMVLNYTESVLFKVGFGVTTFYFIASYIAVSVFYFKIRTINHLEDRKNALKNI